MKELFNTYQLIKSFNAKSLIVGTTLKEGVPVSCPVRVYDRESGVLISKSFSNSNGSYILFGSHFIENIVIALDPKNEFNIAAQDNVK